MLGRKTLTANRTMVPVGGALAPMVWLRTPGPKPLLRRPRGRPPTARESPRSFGLAGEVLSDELPVDQVPERFHVFRARVAVVDVIGVFPHVAGQQRLLVAGAGASSVAGAGQGQAAVGFFHQPSPTGTKGADGALGEFFLERSERTELSVNGIGQAPVGSPPPLGDRQFQ